MGTIRSLLFVPVLKERFIEKAPGTGAHAIILDLEASIALDRKVEAREALAFAVGTLHENGGAEVVARINAGSREDMQAVAESGADAIMVPTVEYAHELNEVAEVLQSLPASRDMRVYPIIETPLGLLNIREIIETGLNFGGIMFGGEDFVMRLGSGAVPSDDSLFTGAYMVAVAARAYGLNPYGVAGSMADFRDVEQFAAQCKRAKGIGMVGTPAVHPGQVEVINREFAPSPEEVARAQKALADFDEAGGVPVVVDGKMIDGPIAVRYRAMLKGEGFL